MILITGQRSVDNFIQPGDADNIDEAITAVLAPPIRPAGEVTERGRILTHAGEVVPYDLGYSSGVTNVTLI